MADTAFRFSFPFRVRYSEIDGQGIVFNAHYLTYFDTAITEYFRTLGYDYKAECGRDGCDFHTVRSLVEYRAPIRFDEEIDVAVKAGRLGRSSIRFDLAVHGRGASAAGAGPAAVADPPPDLRATGEIVWVHTDQATHTSTPLPGKLVDMLVAFEGAAILKA